MPRKPKNSPPDIFDYVDYQLYLQDWYRHKKKGDRHFTYRTFAEKSGVSASLINEIISGHHKLTIDVMAKCSTAMGLDEKEHDYFATLVQFNNGKTNAEKAESFERIAALRGRTPARLLDKRRYEYFSKWYYPVIREFLTQVMPDAAEEEIAAAVTPSLNAAQVRKAKKLLKALGLATEDSHGRLHVTSQIVATEFETRSIAVKAFHIKLLAIAQEALERFPAENREFETMTLSMSSALYRQLKDRMRAFSIELLNLVRDEQAPAEVVCQFGMQLFPFNKDMENP